MTGGNGAATLWRGHITAVFADIQPLKGSSIYVTVSVLTDIGERPFPDSKSMVATLFHFDKMVKLCFMWKTQPNCFYSTYVYIRRRYGGGGVEWYQNSHIPILHQPRQNH